MDREAVMRIAIGADHGGYQLKEILLDQLEADRHQVIDVGTFSAQSCDYPKVGEKVATALSKKQVARGILLCKSGAGMAIVANKFPGVRAAVCQSVTLAKHSRAHNDTNLLVLGASGLSRKKAGLILSVWLKTGFAGGRHARRVNQIKQLEKKVFKSSATTRPPSKRSADVRRRYSGERWRMSPPGKGGSTLGRGRMGAPC
jgi:RpiB/LacA/LacB family sugar-phosphate isomerase